jgi:hypothetical protein
LDRLFGSVSVFAVLACAASLGCAAAEPEHAPPSAESLATSSDRIFAIGQDGDVVYVAREDGIERVDGDGAVSRVAGAEYRACPRDPDSAWWAGDERRHGGASFAVRDGVAVFAKDTCGVWTRDLHTGVTTMLLARDDLEGRKPGSAAYSTWYSGTTLHAGEDGEVLVCISRGGVNGTTVELWRTDAGPSARMALLPEADRCGAVIADGTAVFVTAQARDHRALLYRIERRSAEASVVARAERFSGIAQDARAVYLIADESVERVDKLRLDRTTLVASEARVRREGTGTRGTRPSRWLAVNDGRLYWFATRATDTTFRHIVERLDPSGGEPETVHDGVEIDRTWSIPGLAFSAGYVHFAWWQRGGEGGAFSVARVAASP